MLYIFVMDREVGLTNGDFSMGKYLQTSTYCGLYFGVNSSCFESLKCIPLKAETKLY
jgi:hypothetical protein